MKFTRELDNEMIFDKEPEAGINPGLVSGISYTDSNGNERNKYQVLTTFSNAYINANRPEPEPESETVVETTPESETDVQEL